MSCPRLALLAFLAACAPTAAPMPNAIDPAAHHLIYLHGKILEDQGLPAESPRYGEYRYRAILECFADAGFIVIAEQRPRNADVTTWAARTVAHIDRLLAAGVPAERITIVGASKGAYIAGLVSHRARNPRLRFVLLAGCSRGAIGAMREHGIEFHGDVLTIRDVADTELAGSCAPVFEWSADIGRHEEIVVQVGSGHGIVYQPLDAWVLPTIAWAQAEAAR